MFNLKTTYFFDDVHQLFVVNNLIDVRVEDPCVLRALVVVPCLAASLKDSRLVHQIPSLGWRVHSGLLLRHIIVFVFVFLRERAHSESSHQKLDLLCGLVGIL